MLGAILRTVRGIEVADDTLSIGAMAAVCLDGPGHFLGHEQTLELMQSEYLYPEVADRSSPKEWVERGTLDVLDRARERTRAILAGHYPARIDDAIDRALRARFPIRLAAADMRPGNGRW